MYRRIAGFIAIPLLVVACSTPGAPSGGAPSVTPPPNQPDPISTEPGASQGGGGDGRASVEITLVNGPRTGHYTDQRSDEGCIRNYSFPGTFAVSSGSIIDFTDGFSGYLVIFIDASTVGSGTDNFQFQVHFNGNNETFGVLPSAIGGTEGTGTATLDDRGDTATITIEATTQEGIEMSATIECDSVTTL